MALANLCRSPAPRDAYEPCPLDEGHHGPCLHWIQTLEQGSRGRNGVWVYDAAGALAVHASFQGRVSEPDVRALLLLRQAIGEALP